MDASMLGSGVLWTDAAAADSLTAELQAQGWLTGHSVLAGDADGDMDKAGVIASIANALDFPDWTGRNLDALYDSLTDLSWVTENKVLLTIDGSANLTAEAAWPQLRSVLIEAAEWWQSHDRTLVIAIT